MVMDLSALDGVLDFMYKDKVNVKRLTDVTDPDTDLTKQDYIDVEGYENIEGKISFRSIDNATVPTGNSSSNPYSLNPELFYPIKYVLKKGDKVVVNIIGNKGEIIGTVKGICGQPKYYQLFSQVEISVEEN